jgi:formylglycine-generating enzyme required for sulfatase activity
MDDKAANFISQYVTGDDSPWFLINWYDAAAYCNWLSDRDGMPQEQWCYEPNGKGEYATGMRMKVGGSELHGYRLPTSAEWEYACRSGTVTSRYFGVGIPLVAKYEICLKNSRNRTWPVGSLKPNDFGLFDTLGNVNEWCHDALDAASESSRTHKDALDSTPVVENSQRIARGGTFNLDPSLLRSATRGMAIASSTGPGFRVVRNYR